MCVCCIACRECLRCVIPVVLPDKKKKLNGTYVYRHKHNYILGYMFTITKAQLHVSAINVSHLQVVHEELIQKAIPACVGSLQFVGWGGARSCFVLDKGVWTGAGERSVDWGWRKDCGLGLEKGVWTGVGERSADWG